MQKDKGFTLLEVLIVLIIVVFLAFLGTNLIFGTFHSKARGLTWRMSSTIKYLYDIAVTENKTVRLALDFENNTYWEEATTERFLMEKTEEKEKKEVKEKPAEEGEEGEGETMLEPNEVTFGSLETPLLEAQTLPSGILIKDVQTSHDLTPVVADKAYIYFFPNGYAEPAIINFKDETDERHISIKINPFNAKTDISSEYRKLEDEK